MQKNFQLKDFIAIGLSCVALSLSAGTAYFSIVRVEENISVIANKEPFAIISDDNLYIAPDKSGEIILINSGNRAAVISRVNFSYSQPSSSTQNPDCGVDAGTNFETDFDPTVLKPNDVVVSKLKITKSFSYTTDGVSGTAVDGGGFVFPLSDQNRGKSDVLVDICLDIWLASPSSNREYSAFPVFRYHAQHGGWAYDPVKEGSYSDVPRVVLSKKRTIFNE